MNYYKMRNHLMVKNNKKKAQQESGFKQSISISKWRRRLRLNSLARSRSKQAKTWQWIIVQDLSSTLRL